MKKIRYAIGLFSIILILYYFSFYLLIRPGIIMAFSDGSSIHRATWAFGKGAGQSAEKSKLYKPVIFFDKVIFPFRYYKVSAISKRSRDDLKQIYESEMKATQNPGDR